MCQRYSLARHDIQFKKELPGISLKNNLVFSYNISPGILSSVITDKDSKSLNSFFWGLVPAWSDGRVTGNLYNARAETITSQTSFRIPIRERRCIIPADSYYTWLTDGVEKIPYRIKRNDGKMLLMAGVWDYWKKDDLEIYSFAIITTKSNSLLSGIDSRMPLIIEDVSAMDRWLSKMSIGEIQDMLVPSLTDLEYYEISNEIDSIIKNSDKLHKRVK